MPTGWELPDDLESSSWEAQTLPVLSVRIGAN